MGAKILFLLSSLLFMGLVYPRFGIEGALPWNTDNLGLSNDDEHHLFRYYGSDIEKETLEDNVDVDLAVSPAYLKTGTTIVGICCKDGVVLGADTRSTGGPLVMDKNKQKIHPISSRIYCGAAGTSADCDQVTRHAAHTLALIRIERELCGEDSLDLVMTAARSISNYILHSGGRRKETVMILGGVDDTGSSLYQIDTAGVPQRISFAALGSGSTDALAVLETMRQTWASKSRNASDNIHEQGFTKDNDRNIEHATMDQAVHAVRKAIQAGILNDMGSGSHVDLCVITPDLVQTWRESLVSTWDADRLPLHSGSSSTIAAAANASANAVASTAGADGVSSSSSSLIDSVKDATPHASLGRIVYSKRRLIKRLKAGEVQQVEESRSLPNMLSNNIHLIK
mmetsp:Transcript_6867/g.11440  ORF Transcript_6867/g.11440 Transcript_6867/m.11440 type:complete len:398 (+) Transcript_6867:20-1213(+)